ncbi:MAG: AMP-binding protein [Parvularculaceae bacterium]
MADFARQILNSPTVAGVVEEQAKLRPDATALIFEGREYSFQELDRWANRAAQAFAKLGIKAGDRVIWLAQNLGVFWPALLGCAKTGIVMTPVNWRLAPAEVAKIIDDAKPVLRVGEKAVYQSVESN